VIARKLLAVANDLFFIVKIQDAAKKCGMAVEFLSNPNDLIPKAVAQKPALIIFDLNLDAVDPIQRILELKRHSALQSIPLLAYVSHVQVELRQKAVDAGCNTVLAKSAFSSEIQRILGAYSGSD
jgi:CheY-like chemotaxis protein